MAWAFRLVSYLYIQLAGALIPRIRCPSCLMSKRTIPHYIGWQHPRIDADKYDLFLEKFITAIEQRWHDALLQFEDFEQRKALPLLNRYQDRLCCFNDDIQGTASLTVGTLLAACHVKKQKLSEQIVVFAGAGSAGCGIAEQIIAQICSEGLSETAARQRIFMVDRQGLLRDSMSDLFDLQFRLAQSDKLLIDWPMMDDQASLLTVIQQAKPIVLVFQERQVYLQKASLKRCISSANSQLFFR